MTFITKLRQRQQLQQWLLILLTTIIFFQTCYRSRVNTQFAQPFIPLYAYAAGIAISEMEYGSEPGIGYLAVYNQFTPLIIWGVDWGPEFSIVNKAIDQALNLKDVTAAGAYYTSYEGLTIFYKLAFQGFGFKAESALYLFWSLLALSILIFMITFYRRLILLFYLLLFTCALFAISQTQGVLLESIIRVRFLPILSILPAFYLSLLIVGQRKRDWVSIAGAVGQTLILVLALQIRSSALYQLLFLLGTTVIFGVLWFAKHKLNRATGVTSLSFWPLALVLVGFLFFKWYTLNPALPNGAVTNRSCTWHMFYMGLAAHPDAPEKYGVVGADSDGFLLVERRAPEWGYEGRVIDAMKSLIAIPLTDTQEEGIPWCGQVYEEIVKDEFLSIFRQDPWFIISSYLYKFSKYFRLYFSPLARDFINVIYAQPSTTNYVGANGYGFGVLDQVINWSIIISLILGIFIVHKTFLQEWLLPLILLVLQFLSALLVPILYRPIHNTIADSALSLTIILLAVFSGGIWYGFHLIERNWSHLNRFKLVYISFAVIVPTVILRIIFGYQPFKPDANELPPRQETLFYRQQADQVFHKHLGFHPILYQDEYYAIARPQLGLIDLNNPQAVYQCQTDGQCVVGTSLEQTKIRVSLLQTETYKKWNIIPYKGRYYVLDQTLDPELILTNNTAWDECYAQHQCVAGNTLEKAKQLTEVKIVLKNYQGFDIVSYLDKFYALSQTLPVLGEGFDPTVFISEHLLQECTAHGQCAIGNSLDEAKQLVGLLTPELVEADYQGFYIVAYNYKFYALPQTFITLDQRLESIPFLDENFWQACQTEKQCVIGNSLEEAKQLVELLETTP